MRKGFFKRSIKHEWKPLEGNPVFRANGKVWIVERCSKTGQYRYTRVPSNKKLREMEEYE